MKIAGAPSQVEEYREANSFIGNIPIVLIFAPAFNEYFMGDRYSLMKIFKSSNL